MHTYNTYLEIFKKGEFQLIHNFDASVVFVVKFSTLFRLALAILCISLNDFVISEQLKVDSFIVASARASVLAKQPPSAVASGWFGVGYTTQCSGAAISTVPPWPKSAKNCPKSITVRAPS